jgi:hypothetical protein
MITEYCRTIISTTVPKRSSGCRRLWPHWLRLGWQTHGYPQAFSDITTAECPHKIAGNMKDPCGAKCPQLPKLL